MKEIDYLVGSFRMKCYSLRKRWWRILAKSLGEKSGSNNKEADTIAFIRLIFVIIAVITNISIVVNIVHNWR